MWKFLRLLLCVLPLQLGLCDVYIKKRTAFVFGGNGQIGAAVVEMLLKDNYNVTILNRGSNYFHSKSSIVPKVTFIECDRFKGLKTYCPAFINYLSNNTHLDVVVDLNAYTTKYMRHSTELFKTTNVGVYVFISPDNVYDVCIKRHHGPTKETDTERPKEKEEYDLYIKADKYGHYKLLAEEHLVTSGLNYLIFRAPDVIGARDTSSKFWIYQMWVKYFDVLNTPIHLPYQVKQLVSSYVYLGDVIQAITKALEKGIRNETFNIAFQEPLTLTTLLLEISHVLNKPITFNNEVSTDESYHLYPSSARGQLDISKAQYLLGFKPTLFKSAIRRTVMFYEKAQAKGRFDDERYKVVQELSSNVATDKTRSKFMSLVMAEALASRTRSRDEL